uniref:Uncharacterized protein n=1 Tax=mine drainage metagenome TaxID=410659 RepID=E6Q6X0_9ZZZZ
MERSVRHFYLSSECIRVPSRPFKLVNFLHGKFYRQIPRSFDDKPKALSTVCLIKLRGRTDCLKFLIRALIVALSPASFPFSGMTRHYRLNPNRASPLFYRMRWFGRGTSQ